MTDEAVRRVGRPSMSVERRGQIVWAFIELVAERGLEQVSLDDVAKAAGVQRAALRHFVGNRDELIVAAVEELLDLYRVQSAEFGADERSTSKELINAMLSDELTHDIAVIYAAWNSLLADAIRRPAARATIKMAFDVQLGMIESALRRDYPSAPPARIRDTAYVVVCLVEQNNILQQLGYPRARRLATRNAVLRLVGRLAGEFGA